MMNDPSFPELEYPIRFPLKVIGLEAEDFETLVVEIVRRHVPDLLEENIISHFSSQSRYRSVSLEFIASSREQVDALYAELSAHPRVLMLL